MPFLLAEILNFQCALHLKGVGSLSKKDIKVTKNIYRTKKNNCGENILLYLPLLEWSERILEVIFSKKQLHS